MDKPSSRTRNLAQKAPYDHIPFSTRLHELLEKHNEIYREAALKSGLDHQSVRRYITGRCPNIMACILLADHLWVNPNELLTLAGWPPLKVFVIHTESAEALPHEAVDVARDIARISSPALRKQVAEAIRTLLAKYFE